MAKEVGGVRNVSRNGQAYAARQREVGEMRASGKYSSVEMATTGTGWVAIERSTAKHKNEEIEAAMHLANAGYKVTLKDEAGYVTSPDGHLFSAAFEQRTPDKAIGAIGVKRSIDHASGKVHKGAQIDVPVIYDKYRRFNRKDVEEGIKMFEQYSKSRFKKIIVVSADGRIHVHRHND